MTDNDNIFVQAPDRFQENPQTPSARRVLSRVSTRSANWLLPFVVLAAPLPLASNHPFAWLFWAVFLGSAAFVLGPAPNPDFHVARISQKFLVPLAAIFIGFAILQSMPLPLWKGGLIVDLPVGQVELPTLSLAPGATVLAAMRVISYLIFFQLVLRHVGSVRASNVVLNVIFFGIVAHAIFSVIALKFLGDTILFKEKSAFLGLATGTFVNKNSFATFLGFGFVLGLSLRGLPAEKGAKATGPDFRFARILGLFAIAAALLLTQSRLGLFATFLASVAVLVPRTVRPLWIIPFALIAAILALVVSDIDILRGYLDVQTSAVSRWQLYQQVARMIADRPLTGFGLGSFPLAFEMYHSQPVTANFVWLHTHSTYLALWVEAGVIVGSLPMVAGAIALRRLWRLSLQHPAARAGFGALILGAIHSIADFSLEIQANAFLLIALIGIGLASTNTKKDEPCQTQTRFCR